MRSAAHQLPAAAELRVCARGERDDMVGGEARREVDRRTVGPVEARDGLAEVVARIGEARGRGEAADLGVEVQDERVVEVAGALGEREDPVAAVARDLQARAADRAAEAALAVAAERLAGATRRIDRAVAVVVDAVAEVGRTGVDRGVAVVAVAVDRDVTARRGARLLGGRRAAEAVSVAVGVVGRGHSLVGRAVAVVVDGVAGLGRAGVDGGAGVVAVAAQGDEAARGDTGAIDRGHGAVAVAVDIRVGVEGVGGEAFVGAARAVVVDAVTDLGRARPDGGIGVVAVGAVRDIARGRAARAGRLGHRGVAVAIAVAVLVVGDRRETLVDRRVAVVVETVAELGRAGIHGVARVVAVGAVRHIAGRLRAGDLGGAARAEGVAIGVAVVGGAGGADRGVAVVAVARQADAVVVGVDAGDREGVEVDIALGVRSRVVVDYADGVHGGEAT